MAPSTARLNLAPGLLPAQDVGVVGPEPSGSFVERGGDDFGSVVANHIDQFANLTRRGPVRAVRSISALYPKVVPRLSEHRVPS